MTPSDHDPNAQPRREGRDVVVLGMHRSGTSALAGSLSLLGLAVGPADDLLPPGEANPKGYFEDRVLVEISDLLLMQQGATWWNPIGVAASRVEPKLREEALDAYRAALSRYPGDADRLIKDPRLCVTFDLLRPAFADPVALLVWRAPEEVAASLNKRDNLPHHLGCALWEYYVLASARAARGLPAITVSYRELLEAPEACIGQVRDFLEGQGVRGLRAVSEEGSAQFVDKGLRHGGRGSDGADDLLTARQKRVVEALRDRDPHALAGLEVSESSLVLIRDFAVYNGMISAMASDLRNTKLDARQLRAVLDAKSLAVEEWRQRALRAEGRAPPQ